MKKTLAFALAIVGLGVAAGSAAVYGVWTPAPVVRHDPISPVWTEIKWPFPMDQWGIGKAFVCSAQDCGTKVEVYVRPKIGFCNCATGVSDDNELERVSDNELVANDARAAGAGRPIKVGWMNGLSRTYSAAAGDGNANLVSAAFNDDCDVVVALAKFAGDPNVIEPAVVSYLKSTAMVLWAKKELGLEFVRRDWSPAP
jgi:hypothetical protein